jgi:hypothetical protein
VRDGRASSEEHRILEIGFEENWHMKGNLMFTGRSFLRRLLHQLGFSHVAQKQSLSKGSLFSLKVSQERNSQSSDRNHELRLMLVLHLILWLFGKQHRSGDFRE